MEGARDLVSPTTAPERFRRLYTEALMAAPGFTLRGGASEILRGIVARSLAVTGALPSGLDEEEKLLGQTAESALGGSRDAKVEFERAGLAEGRNAGLREGALVARIAAYHAAPDELFEQIIDAGPLLRAVQMAGAAARARDLTITYASERQQFGQAVNRFQAVQQQLAEMAGESAAADAAVEQALASPTAARISAAKVVAGRSAARVAKIAH